MAQLTNAEDKKMVEEISRAVVSETAPEEISLFDQLVQDYYKRPDPQTKSASARDDPLGFGVDGGLITALTPAVVAITTQVLLFLKDEVLKSVKEEGATAIRQRIKALLEPAVRAESSASAAPQSASAVPTSPQQETAAPSFGRENLATIRRIARQEAEKYGIPREDAEKIANSLIGRLVLA